MPLRLEDYALIGDNETVAFVGCVFACRASTRARASPRSSAARSTGAG